MRRRRIIQTPQVSDTDISTRLAQLGQMIAGKREEAIKARSESGIEKVWNDCEEAYLGMDALNRGEFKGAKWAKPTSPAGPVTTDKPVTNEVRSTAFVRLTSRYVDAGSAKLSEILFPIDDKAFSFSATPVPDLIKQKDDLQKIIDNTSGGPILRAMTPQELAAQQHDQQAAQQAQPQPGAAPAPAAGQAAPQMPMAAGAPIALPPPKPVIGVKGQAIPPGMIQMTAAEMVKLQMDKADDAADLAENRVYDWLVECNYPKEGRKVVKDAARIGTGILKGPFPDEKKSQAITRAPKGGVALQIQKKVAPVCRWIDPWNFFPDGSCGEDIHLGEHTFERDFITEQKLKALRGRAGYIDSQINQVILEGPQKCNLEQENPHVDKPVNKKLYTIWYFYGVLNRADMAMLNQTAIVDVPEDQEDVFALVTVVNDCVVRATINPLDSGRLPYNVVAWSRRAGSWAGVGISEQVAMPQRMCNASTRSLLNNAGFSAGVQIVMNKGVVTPADGNYAITPNKIWYITGEPTDQNLDATKVFNAVIIPNVGDQLMKIVEYAFRLAEEASNIPVLAQGQTGERMPDTFGAAELLNSNANTLLRDIGYSYDDGITEPMIHAFYEWLLLDPTVPDDEKGDFDINAHGSIALVERAIQEQTLMALGQMALNPVFGVDPKKWFAEMMRSKRLDPRKIQYTDAEQAILDKQPPQPPIQIAVETLRGQNALAVAKVTHPDAAAPAGQPGQPAPVDPSVQVAQIRAQSAEKIAGAQAQAENAYVNTEAQIARDNANARHQEAQDKRELLILEYSLKNNITLEQVKADLAKTGMQEQTKRQLGSTEQQLLASENHKDRVMDLHKHNSDSLVNDQMATPVTP